MTLCLIPLRSNWSKCIVILIGLIIFLQILNLNLSNQLHMRQDYIRGKRGPKRKSTLLDGVEKKVYNLIEKAKYSSVLDSSGNYKIVNNFLESDMLKESSRSSRKANDVTLVTQGTLSYLVNLEFLVRQWSGPISVALFLPNGELVQSAISLYFIHQCLPSVRKSVSFHLIYLLNQPLSTEFKDGEILKSKCDGVINRLFKTIEKSHFSQNYNHKVLYPVNLLRNVARRNSWTEFIFLTDMDMYPNARLYHEFLSYMESRKLIEMQSSSGEVNQNVIYVVPAFEIHADVPVPSNKAELLELQKSSKVQSFYHDFCSKCQSQVNYDKWEQLNVDLEFGVAYNVKWKDPWEPFYISHNKVPLYDERFVQYGFNRISQVCELHIAGFLFSVLNNAFLLHKGFKSKSSFHEGKNEDLLKNRMLYRSFKNELKLKYPDSTKRCY